MTIKSVLLIVLVGVLVFGSILFTGFYGDDKHIIVQARIVHSLQSISLFFISSIPFISQNGHVAYSYYKPLMFLSYSILYLLGHGQPFIFHLFQVILHITNAVLLFYLFVKIFDKRIALFLSLLFLIHPVNEEVVAYIACLQDTLFLFFGLLGLLVLQRRNIILRHILLVIFLFFLSILSKETGILFFAMGLIYIAISKIRQVKPYLIGSFFIICVYVFLRIIASYFYFIRILSVPLLNNSLYSRLFISIRAMASYIKEIILPTDTITPINQELLSHVSSAQIFLQVLFIIFFIILTCIAGYLIWRKSRNFFIYFLFFSLWFYMGIGAHLQIIPLDEIVAKRWLYFPLVGLLGMLGCIVKCIKI